MLAPPRLVYSSWSRDKFPDTRPCPGIIDGNYFFFNAIKHYFKTRHYIPVGYNFLWFLFFFLLQSLSRVQAQNVSDYAVHANIIYRFTKYIDWPASKKTGDFIIGVAGQTPLYEELKKTVVNKMVGDQKIVIKKVSSSAGFLDCHILFISEDESSSLKKIVSGTEGASMLIVSESDGLARKGSCINFMIVDDRLKLEINKNNIEQRNLSIASELLQLGKIVK